MSSNRIRARRTTLGVPLLLSALAVLPHVALADDMDRTFNSYHAFFVVGKGENRMFDDIVRQSAIRLREQFANRGWQTTLYPAGQFSLETALAAMEAVKGQDELIFFYYVGHGGGYRGGSPQPDSPTSPDESQKEDPPPPGVTEDRIDETLDYFPGKSKTDDALGSAFDRIQKTHWVSGVIDACHANGMLDGSQDIRGRAGRSSVWGSSATEWEVAGGGCGGSGVANYTRDLLRGLGQTPRLRTLGDINGWLKRTGQAGHAEAQTYGAKVYQGTTGTKCYYPGGSTPVGGSCRMSTSVPEPHAAALLGLGLILLGATRARSAGRERLVRRGVLEDGNTEGE
jgi:hypothetical protein